MPLDNKDEQEGDRIPLQSNSQVENLGETIRTEEATWRPHETNPTGDRLPAD
ncbi:hypothetical protein [Oscillatoria acuminata]|uniref:hypothetical protein n=1 Tax=Oscillatoria acuminata TaxID=118323 RepID=UPI000305A107|nr:hypothetical protein [Oscillatoria acuminata]